MIKRVLLYFIFIIIFLGTGFIVFADITDLFIGGGKDKTSSNGNFDEYTINKYLIEYVDNKSEEYIEDNLRVILKSGNEYFIESNEYGEFYINDKLFLYKGNITSNCNNNISYIFSGSLNNEYWGDLEIKNNSYYCPENKKMLLHLFSNVTGDLILTNGITNVDLLELENAQGEKKKITVSEIFSAQDISINGLINSTKNIGDFSSELEFSYSDSSNSYNNAFIDSNAELSLSEFKRNIDKNVFLLTKGITAKNDNPISEFDEDEDIYFYDYSGENLNDSSHLENQGKILQLGNGGFSNNFDKIEVKGEKTLIINGGNLYINADIYNNNNNSILVIVVKRDDTNKKNGGNIYIDPNVTNIDAILISEGSILNYDGSDVLTIENEIYSLRSQLLIYGAISTKNTIGINKSIYGTDDYMIDGEEDFDINKYNLGNLRSFRIVRTDDFNDGVCKDPGKIGALGNITLSSGSSGILREYAFAGKKKCYINDSNNDANLRQTEKTSGVVIEYNPMIQVNTPKILKIN